MINQNRCEQHEYLERGDNKGGLKESAFSRASVQYFFENLNLSEPYLIDFISWMVWNKGSAPNPQKDKASQKNERYVVCRSHTDLHENDELQNGEDETKGTLTILHMSDMFVMYFLIAARKTEVTKVPNNR